MPRVKRSYSDGDWEFEMHICPVCTKESMGKAMSPCSECRKLTCQNCGLIVRGCGKDNYSRVCELCQKKVFKGKRKYCTEMECKDCDNKSPRFKKAMERKSGQYEAFRRQFDAVAWKKTHQPINYVGRYTGRWLADMILSEDGFERGYIDWLIREGEKPRDPQYTEAQNKNFAIYVEEALALTEMIAKTMIVPRVLRKLKD
jgi:hypothetical protein